LGGEAVSRRFAAILAIEYSRPVEAEEEETLECLESLCHDPIDPKIALHKGRTLKTPGDGMLVEFANAVEAVPMAAGR